MVVARTTTGWRQRYFVEVSSHYKTVDTHLLRGRMKKTPDGSLLAQLSKDKHGKWVWTIVATKYGFYSSTTHTTYERYESDVMVAHLAKLRLEGYQINGEVPTW
jgi:hypothetical protein